MITRHIFDHKTCLLITESRRRVGDWNDGRLHYIYVTLFSICENPFHWKGRQMYRQTWRMTWFVGSTLVLYCSNGCFALPHTMYMYMCMYVTFWGFAFWGSTRSYKVINLFFNTCSGEQLPSVSPQFVCVSHTKICESGNIQRASERATVAMCVLCAC